MHELIKVVDIRQDPDAIYIGRAMPLFGLSASALANPFRLSKEQPRDEQQQAILGSYRRWLWKEIKSRQGAAYNELLRLRSLLLSGEEVKLGCWCAPKSCHGDVVKAALLYLLNEGAGDVAPASINLNGVVIKTPLKALSLTQPWLWSILHAGKSIENRKWPTYFRGTCALHAAKGMKDEEYHSAKAFIEAVSGLTVPKPEELVRGAIVGLVDIVDCVKVHTSPWFFGKYGFVLENPRILPTPIACKGALNFWDVPGEITEQILQQLTAKQ